MITLLQSYLQNLQFAWPWAVAALALPPLVYLLFPAEKNNQSAALRFPHTDAMESLLTSNRPANAVGRWFLVMVVFLLLTVAAARPQQLGETVYLPLAGRNVMLATDISGSMEAADMIVGANARTRLQAVKDVAGEFILRRRGDRVGLILFGELAYLQVPLSFDVKTAHTLLLEAEIGLAGLETAIGDAIGLAVKRLRDASDADRILVLLTDGENTAGSIDPLRAADLAAQEGVRIYAIGIGATEMVVRSLFGQRRVVNSQLDEQTLTAIADKTGGRYFRASDMDELEDIYALIDDYEPVSEDDQSYRPVDELYFWPLGLALLITALSASATLFRRLRLGGSHPIGAASIGQADANQRAI